MTVAVLGSKVHQPPREPVLNPTRIRGETEWGSLTHACYIVSATHGVETSWMSMSLLGFEWQLGYAAQNTAAVVVRILRPLPSQCCHSNPPARSCRRPLELKSDLGEARELSATRTFPSGPFPCCVKMNLQRLLSAFAALSIGRSVSS